MQDFGKLFRRERLNAKKSMGDVARALGKSVPYVADVENARRGPFTTEDIIKAATLLGTDPEPLLAAAAIKRGRVELDTRSAKAIEVGAALARVWSDLDDKELQAIATAIAHHRPGGHEK
jgi:transcriptional regulator with XRE-family HTH domain